MSNEFFVRVVRRVIVILVPKSKPGELARIARDARDDGQPEVGVLTRILGGKKDSSIGFNARRIRLGHRPSLPRNNGPLEL
ncbi:MAG: hypothetical protein QNL99_09890 [SAR86 cluster bacterium]|jgi:hypothetical protein|uniref:Uncharacterized protein n=1 Tax=SAR86 cluster bacterium TaxID=2030880 RepID=A0A973A8Y1_9GAMM|nr:hypothetical protein [SAR86 cluster bacterium]